MRLAHIRIIDGKLSFSYQFQSPDLDINSDCIFEPDDIKGIAKYFAKNNITDVIGFYLNEGITKEMTNNIYKALDISLIIHKLRDDKTLILDENGNWKI